MAHARSPRVASRLGGVARRRRTARRIAAERLEARRVLAGNVSGMVFEDLDSDTVVDSGEGLAGWNVYADLNDNGLRDGSEPQTTSSQSGSYSLGGLPAGAVVLRLLAPPGWQAADASRTVTVIDNTTVANQHLRGRLGEGGLVTGAIWNDADGNGTRESGETLGLSISVFADLDNDSVLDPGEPTASTTSTNGGATQTYRLTVAQPGTYTIRQRLVTPWQQVVPAAAAGHAVTVGAGQRLTAPDFVVRNPVVTVSGSVFEDVNGNATRESTDPPLAGWRVYADLNRNGSADSNEPAATSNASGFYTLSITTQTALATLAVRTMLPAGWQATGGGNERTVNAPRGGTTYAANFGNQTSGGIVSGGLWNDTNGDGLKASSEGPLAGRTIYADLDDDGTPDADEPQAVSLADGSYQLLIMTAGTVNLRQVVPAGWEQTFPGGGNPQSVTITLASAGVAGSRIAGRAFAARSTSFTLSGMVFEDVDSNGSRATTESPLAGWRVFADRNDNGVLDVGEPSAVTSASGEYAILLPSITTSSTVKFRLEMQTGWQSTFPNPAIRSMAVAPGGVAANQHFGVKLQGRGIGGTVWNDVDADGTRGAAEVGLGGWTVYVDVNNNGTLDSTEPRTGTAPDGSYVLPLTASGDYTVRQVRPQHWLASTPADGARTVTVAATRVNGVDFGYRSTLGYVSGSVFDDANENGAADVGEMGLGGWRIYADLNDNGKIDGSEPQTSTSPTGTYALAIATATGSLAVKLRTIATTGWSTISPAGGAHDVTVAGGQTIAGKHFGVRPGGAVVSGIAWSDDNGDGVFDAREAPLSGMTIFADGNGNGAADVGEPRTTTMTGGAYQLLVPVAGSYTIRPLADPSWATTAPVSGGHAVTVGTADRLTGRDFGRRRAVGFVSGSVYHDADGSGAMNGGDAGLGGWRVFVDLNGNGTLDNTEPATISGTTGGYSLQVPLAGLTLTTTVRTQLQSGWSPVQPAGGVQTVTIAAGQTVTARNFGFGADASVAIVGGTAFNDANGDGVLGTGEQVFGGRTIYVDVDGDGVLDTDEPRTTTGPDGGYRLAFTADGTYTLRQVLPFGFVQTAPANGGIEVTIAVGNRLTGRHFASRWSVGAISGTVFHDVNADGFRDAAEAGLAGWRVYVDVNGNDAWDPTEPSTFTSSDGNYGLGGVVAATSSVAVRTVVPAGWAATLPDAGEQAVTIVPGSTVGGRNFGNRSTVPTATGVLWNDLDADGVRDAGEAGLGGRAVFVDVDADGSMDADEPRVYTAGDGSYRLLLPGIGTHAIRQLLPQGWSQTAPAGAARSVEVATIGAASTGNDFGSRFTMGQISGFVFNDINANGTVDAGEGTANVRVYADLDEDDTLDPNEPTFVTSSSGAYVLTVSTYDAAAPTSVTRLVSVRTLLPAGWSAASPASGERAVTLTAGPAVSGQNFTVFLSGATVAGVVWNDSDGDGVRGSAEAGLGGWTVYVDANDNGTPDATELRVGTAGDGSYRLFLPTAGAYTIKRVAPNGWIATAPASGGHAVTVAGGESFAARNFGVRAAFGTVTGMVYDDSDQNGSRGAEEPGLAGWQVFADLDGDGVAGAGEPSTRTSSSGGYTLQIPTVTAASRQISLRVVPQVGWSALAPAAAVDAAVPVTGGQTTAARNFGFRLTGTIVAGTAWNDLNGNGTREAGDGPISSRTVYADLDGDSVPDQNEPRATTGPDGAYRLLLSTIGSYTLRQILPGNWAQTTPSGGHAVTVDTAGVRLSGYDFGSRSTVAAVSGTVFEDLDADGTRDTGEPGLAGVRVYADLNDDGTPSAGEPSFVTSPSGQYFLTIPNLAAASSIKIRQAAFAGWGATLPADSLRVVQLDGGKTVSGADFGNQLTGALVSGVVWDDLDNDGIRDTGERGVGGRTVFVDGDGDGLLDAEELRTTTLGDGSYRIVLTAAGDAAIRTILPIGWRQSLPASGPQTVSATLGNRFPGVDFGTRLTTGSLNGVVFDDLDGSGGQDTGETRLGGWVVFVDANDNGTLDSGEPRATTNSTGSYVLSGLAEGPTRLRIQLQAGWIATSPAGGVVEVSVAAGKTSTAPAFGVRRPPATA